jgi:hypothetical protein
MTSHRRARGQVERIARGQSARVDIRGERVRLPEGATGDLVPKPTLAVDVDSATLVDSVWLRASSVAAWFARGPELGRRPTLSR